MQGILAALPPHGGAAYCPCVLGGGFPLWRYPVDNVLVCTVLNRVLRTLPRRQAQAWTLINLRGLTQQEAADVLGVTRQRISAASESARLVLRKELS